MAASFSSLALTQVLPFLPLAQGDIDYQTERRSDPDLIADVLSQPSTSVIFVRDGLVAVPDGQAARVDFETAKMRLAGVPGQYILRALTGQPGEGADDAKAQAKGVAASEGDPGIGENIGDTIDETANRLGIIPVFLGSYGAGSEHPQSVVALDVSVFASRISEPGDGGNPQAERNQVLQRALQRFDWVSLIGFAPHASARQAGEATTAVALSNWRASQKYCPRCGSRVVPAMAGWAQRCVNEGCKAHRSPLFARIEPAVIVSIVDGKGRLLLQHNRAWKDPSHYSVCAGFVEAGENLEHAVKREVAEETGLALGEVKYLGSQPWPFPGSLMVAFKARALGTQVSVDGGETLDARFLSRDEFREALIVGRIAAPGKATVARYMIEEWYGQEL
ncbi:NAD(+) diphosphatase [Bifidobacterium sp. ESL0800]|uniref:NAD(+) diphosphatase n=1 Tax=Bifidobacterium sp. ESL0800 TaxID=2983236 RepID=UPI0023F9A0AE|nr:NAD(+) diphosphatase [Bifidobacterium sp. ESL0800]WEV75652.1 NAD(+) diphosphatase [Bifidobacterium sp. ESL0800]